ncbi:uncharacterized protein [Solanum lycopersicum]|uniref:uncharacterized protein n=1 Tax=Solanum lycopersicum TaxID=4081 RepID=UPI003749E366
MEENRNNVSAQERTSERNLRRRTRYAQMSPERKQEVRHYYSYYSYFPHFVVEASEDTNLPVTLTTGHHQSNSTGALTINTSSLSPQQVEAFEVTNLPVNLTTGEHQLNSTGSLTISTSLLFPQEVEASEAINLPVTSTRGESIVNCLSTFEVGSTSGSSYAASRSSSRRTSNRGMLLSTIVKKLYAFM